MKKKLTHVKNRRLPSSLYKMHEMLLISTVIYTLCKHTYTKASRPFHNYVGTTSEQQSNSIWNGKDVVYVGKALKTN